MSLIIKYTKVAGRRQHRNRYGLAHDKSAIVCVLERDRECQFDIDTETHSTTRKGTIIRAAVTYAYELVFRFLMLSHHHHEGRVVIVNVVSLMYHNMRIQQQWSQSRPHAYSI